MKRLLLVLAVLSTLNSCKKENIPVKEKGTVILHHSSLNMIYYYEIDGEQPQQVRYNIENVDCSTQMVTILKLSEGDHTIRISNSGSCPNASGFTQTFRLTAGSCLISKISCSSTEL